MVLFLTGGIQIFEVWTLEKNLHRMHSRHEEVAPMVERLNAGEYCVEVPLSSELLPFPLDPTRQVGFQAELPTPIFPPPLLSLDGGSMLGEAPHGGCDL